MGNSATTLVEGTLIVTIAQILTTETRRERCRKKRRRTNVGWSGSKERAEGRPSIQGTIQQRGFVDSSPLQSAHIAMVTISGNLSNEVKSQMSPDN